MVIAMKSVRMKIVLAVAAALVLCCGSVTAQTLEQLARQNFLDGKFAEAKPQFQRCLKTAPKDSRINFWYGACCLETGEVDEALPYLEFAASKRVQNAFRYLARYHYLKGNYAEAADNLEVYLGEANPNDSVYVKATEFMKDIRSRLKFMRRVEKVTFVDSIVVEKSQFLQAYHAGSEAGAVYTLDEYFNKRSGIDGTIFLSEFGNRRYFTCPADSGRLAIGTSYRMRDEWSGTQLVEGLAEGGDSNYPFMLPDGVTFYYANNGPESMGGYDIFVTRYNADNDRFLRSENVGMPFNSPANDYMLVVDELNGLGWFATDRRQPEGMVCVYTFVWNEGRREYYDSDTDDPAVIRRAADIVSIAESQTDAAVVRKANQSLFRLMLNEQNMLADNKSKGDFVFVLDDLSDYHRLTDFHSPDARKTYERFLEAREELASLTARLESQRDEYADAPARRRESMAAGILKLEEDVANLTAEVATLEKRARNLEKEFLSK